VTDLCPKVELLIVNVFVPLYFAYSGLNTRIGALNTPALVFAMLFQVFLASIGKILPVTGLSYFLYKQSGIFSVGLGFLINTRGLVSLIAANIGRTEGVFNDIVFSSLVLVNVLTTVVTPPIFYLLYEKYGLNEQMPIYSHPETELVGVQTHDPSDKGDGLSPDNRASQGGERKQTLVFSSEEQAPTAHGDDEPESTRWPNQLLPVKEQLLPGKEQHEKNQILTTSPSKEW